MKPQTFFLIVGFSLLVHLPGITSPLLDYHAHRQCQTASMARNYVRHGMHFWQPEVDTLGVPVRAGTEFPIYSYLLAVLFRGFGVHDFLGRLLSSLFAAWGAVFLYLFVRRRLEESVALMSALVMCVIPIHIYFTRTVQPEPMALWGVLGFLWAWDGWLGAISGKWQVTSGKKQGAFLVLSVLFGALAPLLKLNFLFLIVPLGLVLTWGQKLSTKKLATCHLSLATIFLLTYAWYSYAKTASVSALPLSPDYFWTNLKPILTWNLWRAQFISRFPELCTTYSGLVLGGIGAWEFARRHSSSDSRACLPVGRACLPVGRACLPAGRDDGKRQVFFLSWFFATVVYTVLIGEYGLIHRYTLLPWAPITAVFIAAGIVSVWETKPSRFWRVVLIILVLGIPLHAALRIKHWYRIERDYLFRAKDVVAKLTRPSDLLLTNTPEHPVLLYYLDRYGYASDLEDNGVEVVERYKAQGARYFFTPTGDSWRRHPEWHSVLGREAQLVYADPEFLLYRL